jgi:putative alpha-hemolysin
VNGKKKIPHYINDPVINRLTAPENKLYRPKINFVKATLVVIGTVIATLGVSFLVALLLRKAGLFRFENKSQSQAFLSVYWIAQLLVLVLTLRYIMIWFIRVYQRYAKSETRLRCCYTPSCSEYAILALKKYGALIGGIKAVKRLLRCGPPGGIDYP